MRELLSKAPYRRQASERAAEQVALNRSLEIAVSTGMLAFGLALFGVLNLLALLVEFLPAVKYPLIKLSITWLGATHEDIDRSITDPVEWQIASVVGARRSIRETRDRNHFRTFRNLLVQGPYSTQQLLSRRLE